MKGDACAKSLQDDGQIKYKSFSTQQIFKHCRICPSRIEMAILRLTWFQRLIKNETHHAVLLTLFFTNRFPFELQSYSLSCREKMHPWVMQLSPDLDLLACSDEGVDLLSFVDNDLGRILFDDQCREMFKKVDIAYLRS